MQWRCPNGEGPCELLEANVSNQFPDLVIAVYSSFTRASLGRLPKCSSCSTSVDLSRATSLCALHDADSACQSLYCNDCWARHLAASTLSGKNAALVCLCHVDCVSPLNCFVHEPVTDVTRLGCPSPKAACILHLETCRALFSCTPTAAGTRLAPRCNGCGRSIEAAELTVHKAVHRPTSECQALVCRPCWRQYLAGMSMTSLSG